MNIPKNNAYDPDPDGAYRAFSNAGAIAFGDKFGGLRAMRCVGINGEGQEEWLCRCRCGNRITADASDLLKKRTVGCGCVLTTGSRARD